MESLLEQKILAGVAAKLRKAEKTLKNKDYISELPRLLRLKTQAQILSGRKREAAGTIRAALAECGKQKNRPEEKLSRKLKRLLTAGKTDKRRK